MLFPLWVSSKPLQQTWNRDLHRRKSDASQESQQALICQATTKLRFSIGFTSHGNHGLLANPIANYCNTLRCVVALPKLFHRDHWCPKLVVMPRSRQTHRQGVRGLSIETTESFSTIVSIEIHLQTHVFQFQQSHLGKAEARRPTRPSAFHQLEVDELSTLPSSSPRPRRLES